MDRLFDTSKLRWSKPFTSAIFGDESSQNESFFVLGVLYFWWKTEDYKNQIAKFEEKLAAIKQDHGISVIKWQDVPKPGAAALVCKAAGFESLPIARSRSAVPLLGFPKRDKISLDRS